MRYLLFLNLIILLLMNVSCGSGGSSAGNSSSSGTTAVEINIGQRGSGSATDSSLSTIPPSVSYIGIRVSGPGMKTRTKVVNIADILEKIVLNIPSGLNRHFEVSAFDENQVMLFYGNTYANLFGKPVKVTVLMVESDFEAPLFNGLKSGSAVPDDAVELLWDAASDNKTPPEAMMYLVYQSLTPGGQNFSSPDHVTVGQTSITVEGLQPATTYYYVVRAKDEAGNMEFNTVEIGVMTGDFLDTTPPDFAGLKSASAASTTSIELVWNSATDNSGLSRTMSGAIPSSGIIYNIYQAVVSGGQNFSNPTYVTVPGVTSYAVNGLVPGTKYYFVVRAVDGSGNIDDNFIEKFARTIREYILSLRVTGLDGGYGDVKVDPPGTFCNGTCIYHYAAGTEVTLYPEPNGRDSYFDRWVGDCDVGFYEFAPDNPRTSDNGWDTVIITMDSDKDCTANFASGGW